MEKIETKNAPANSSTFLLADGRYIRVHLRLMTPDADLVHADNIDVQTSAYEVNKAGDFIVDDNGEPVMLPKSRTRIPLAPVRLGQDTMNAGWIATDLTYDPKKPRKDVEDVRQLKHLPKSGKPGDRIYVEDDKKTYVWSEGLYEIVRRQVVTNFLATAPASTPLDQAQIASLKP